MAVFITTRSGLNPLYFGSVILLRDLKAAGLNPILASQSPVFRVGYSFKLYSEFDTVSAKASQSPVFRVGYSLGCLGLKMNFET